MNEPITVAYIDGVPGSTGAALMPGALSSAAGVPLRVGFAGLPLALVDIAVQGEAVVATTVAAIEPDVLARLSGYTPALALRVTDERIVASTGVRQILAAEILELGLCEGPNVDERIQPLGPGPVRP